MNHNFGEKKEEFSAKQGKNIPVWQTPKFEVSKQKAIEVIESGKYGVSDGDFWILMNETKGGKMAYTGLITSHNACLKINDVLESKFVPSCVSIDKEGYNGSLVYSYCNDEQGIYEVGEVSKGNCKNDYPYAMAYKRLFDRVVLKLSKLAYSGVYSEAESEEFRDPIESRVTDSMVQDLMDEIHRTGISLSSMLKAYNVSDPFSLTTEQWRDAIKKLGEKEDKR